MEENNQVLQEPTIYKHKKYTCYLSRAGEDVEIFFFAIWIYDVIIEVNTMILLVTSFKI